MWVLLNDSFLSIVRHRSKPNHLLVRARRREDWNSMRATRPCTSGSPATRAASTRPRRSASRSEERRVGKECA